jgi:D-tyrosyl-tRNA(Tyr) deacylase
MEKTYSSFGLIPTEKLDQLFTEIGSLREEIKAEKVKNSKKLSETWLDKQDVMLLLKVSLRTLQNMRDTLVLPYSKIGAKIYYRATDIQKILEDNYND